MSKPVLNIGLIGYQFMGKAHSNAYRQANHFFDLPAEINMHTICGRNVFSNGSGADLVYAEDLSSREVAHPAPDDIAEVESLGQIGQVLLGQLKAEFEKRRR